MIRFYDVKKETIVYLVLQALLVTSELQETMGACGMLRNSAPQ